MPALEPIINGIVQEYERLRTAGVQCRAAHAAYLQELENEYKRRVGQAASEFQRATSDARNRRAGRLAQLNQQWLAKQASIRRDVFNTNTALRFVSADWNASVWNQFTVHAGPVPTGTRLGIFNLTTAAKLPPIPALAPILGQKHVLIAFQGGLAEPASQLLQSIALRLAATFPAGAFRFSFIDPDGLGKNLKIFLTLPELVRGEDIVVTEKEIEDELARTAAHIKNVIQTRLSSNFSTIEEYNAHVKDVSVPYQFVVIANFPVQFSDRAAAQLVSIAQNGPQAGVYLLATVDLDKKPPSSFEWNTLHNLSTVLKAQRDDEFSWNDPEFYNVAIIPDRMPIPALTKVILESVGKAAEQQGTAGLKFSSIATPPPWWSRTSTDKLSVAIGKNGSGATHCFEVGQGLVHHAMIGGQTGSGKTNLLHVLITNLAMTYSPAELELYLVDFKEGVEFQDYVTFDLPHARAVALESEREFGLSILHRLEREMEDRAQKFRAAGESDLEGYRRKTGRAVPRILLLVDEYQILFNEDDRLSQEAGNVLSDLVRRGRSFGIHIVLSSQSPASNFTSNRAAYGQMALRLCFQCREADARLILGDDNDAAKSLERPGEMYYNDANGRLESNVFVRVALLPPPERRQYLSQVRQLAQSNNVTRAEPMAVFYGSAPSQLLDNSVLRQMLWSSQYASPHGPAYAPLGEAIEIKPHTAALLERQGRANLLMLGSDELYARGMFTGALLGIAAQRAPKDVMFYLLDFGSADIDPANTFGEMKKFLPHPFELTERSQAGQLVERLDKVVTKRATQSGFHSPQIFFFIFGAHRWRELRSPDPYIQTDLSKSLTHIAQDGPEVGVHLVLWLDTLANFERALRRQGIEFFDLRAATLMSQNEAVNYLENPVASKLGPNRAVYRTQEWETGRLEKFKPYALPDAQALDTLRKRFARKQ
ncbi:MAG TPA: FtsK/SpoIIIE domain-containing protein [Anaerolineae bacterium]|nr:FtsK/SpoIIIE domain-containing protein [Anaerolineae bacterium]